MSPSSPLFRRVPSSFSHRLKISHIFAFVHPYTHSHVSPFPPFPRRSSFPATLFSASEDDRRRVYTSIEPSLYPNNFVSMYIHSTCILFDVLAIKHAFVSIVSYRSLCLTFNGTSYFIWSEILLLDLRRHVGLDRVFFMNTKTPIFLLYFREMLLSCSFYKIETFYFIRFYPSKCIIDH